MFYTYILMMCNKQFYTGYSADLKRRVREHSAGGDKTTSKFLPVKLIFYEAFLHEHDAKRREKYFKTNKGKTTLRLMLYEYLRSTK
ncbi:MAG: GIY-YIG nuclease family protein [Candidatus Magasanikbacteria bacterium]|nr:GIY-YIG nuclease family protein [Candidatus Magasanikbacteria bacterium]